MTSPRVPLPVYTGPRIVTCPDCDSDLEYAGGDEYWCRADRRAYHFTQVVTCEDWSPDD